MVVPHSVLPLLLVASLDSAGQVAPPPASPTPPAARAPQLSAQSPAVRRLDGFFEDWATLDPVSTRYDKVGDATGTPDLVLTSMATDVDALWLLVDFAEPVTLQGLERPLTILVEADGDAATGARLGQLPGADFAIVFSPPSAATGKRDLPTTSDPSWKGGEGTSLHTVLADGSLGPAVPHEVTGLGVAPAHASKRFEIRLPRDTFDFRSRSVAALVAFLERRADGTILVHEEIPISQGLVVPRPADRKVPHVDVAGATSLIRRSPDRAPGEIRVVSWNAELGRIFSHPDAFGATLKALEPDVVVFQELGKSATGPELAAWMQQHVGGSTPWQALVSGGDLRVGIVSRTPLANAPFLDGLQRGEGSEARSVRVHGAVVDIEGKPWLFVSLHLKCCGKLGSREDATRRAEVEAIHSAIERSVAKQAEAKAPYAGIVVAGDFNLVGDPAVLTRAGRALDVDGSDLDVLNPMQLDGVTNVTWRSRGAVFVPSRLDFALVSGGSLDVTRSFVMSPEDLAPEARAALSLPADPEQEPSDHLPVVFDLRVRPAVSRE